MPAETNGSQSSLKAFKKTPAGWQKLWTMEFMAAERAIRDFHSNAQEVLELFRAKAKPKAGSKKNRQVHLNLLQANTDTLDAMLYGKVPSVDVTRKHPADVNDESARVGANIMERLANLDIEREDDSYKDAMQYALRDRLTTGFGFVRLRYVVEMGEREVPPIEVPMRDPMTGATQLDEETGEPLMQTMAEGYSEEFKKREDVETDYVYWEDVLWSPGRTWHNMRWVAFRVDMTYDAMEKRFGKEKARRVQYEAKTSLEASTDSEDAKSLDPWNRVEVWEIWSKELKKVFWFVKGQTGVLDVKDDPLGLKAFWPFPKPFTGFLTTESYLPKPDYLVAKDLYDEADLISTRIQLLERALKVAGVYDKKSGEVKRLLSENTENELIPCDNWAMLAEKGGLKGVVDWFPLENIASTLQILRDYRTELLNLLYQVTGMSDVVRGQSTQANATATEQAIKARFASVRLQRLQDEFARFCTDTQRIRSEIISKFFDDETIIQRSGIMQSPDAQYAEEAVKMLRDENFACYRIEVKPESVNLTDFAALRQERVEFVTAMSQYLGAIQPIVQAMPPAMPFFLDILKWFMTGFKGASEVESIMDAAIEAAKQFAAQATQNPQGDPAAQAEKAKLEVAKQKGMMDLQVTKVKTQAGLIKAQSDVRKAQQLAQVEREREMFRRAVGVEPTDVGTGGPPNQPQETRA